MSEYNIGPSEADLDAIVAGLRTASTEERPARRKRVSHTSVRMPADPARAAHLLIKTFDQRYLVKLLSELGYSLHVIGAVSQYPAALREILQRIDKQPLPTTSPAACESSSHSAQLAGAPGHDLCDDTAGPASADPGDASGVAKPPYTRPFHGVTPPSF